MKKILLALIVILSFSSCKLSYTHDDYFAKVQSVKVLNDDYVEVNIKIVTSNTIKRLGIQYRTEEIPKWAIPGNYIGIIVMEQEEQ